MVFAGVLLFITIIFVTGKCFLAIAKTSEVRVESRAPSSIIKVSGNTDYTMIEMDSKDCARALHEVIKRAKSGGHFQAAIQCRNEKSLSILEKDFQKLGYGTVIDRSQSAILIAWYM
jgi:hypothetical protein